MLVDLGYVERTDPTHYRLVRLPGEMTGAKSSWGSLLRLLADPLLQAVAATGESGFLAVLTDGKTVHYLNKIMPEREIRYDRDITVPRLACKVSSGIVLLGSLPTDDMETYAVAAARAGDTMLTAADLVAEVQEALNKGYHANPRGIVEGAAGVAAPIRDRSGTIVAALNIAGPAARMSESLGDITQQTVSHAHLCSAKLTEARAHSFHGGGSAHREALTTLEHH